MTFAWPPRIDDAPSFTLRRARVPSCLVDGAPAAAALDRAGLVELDIEIVAGRIAALRASGAGEGVDLDSCQVWPCFVDMHAHLDKGHIWPRAENADGSFAGAIEAARADRERHWTPADVEARMVFALRAAYAHGTASIRTHLDSTPPLHRLSWPLFARLRAAWRGRVELQAVPILPLEQLEGPFGDELADLVAASGGVFGALALPAPDLGRRLDRAFALAAARGLDLDFHADESLDPAAQALGAIAAASLRHRFPGRVSVGHCCSLAVQPADVVARTLDLVAQARLAIVSLPMCNLFLQDRAPGATPRRRGVTLLHELRARGVEVALASDNCRDPFFAYGDHDMLEVFGQAARIAHLDRPVEPWPAALARVPADVMRLPERGRIAPGGPADLVVFNARGYSELLARPQSDRLVLRGGRIIDRALPSYRELDAIVGREAAR